tara:strand:- start:389 stop:784 length:396 start_codon:yes stop_codon:yes gene_type:complete
MEDIFKFELISPEKIIFSGEARMVTLPSYEGDMSILKSHIPIITFLRPGIIKVQKKENDFLDFFLEDGTVEFYEDKLVVLSSSAVNLKNISKEIIERLNEDAKKKLENKDITDHDRYILNHKLEVLKEIRV